MKRGLILSRWRVALLAWVLVFGAALCATSECFAAASGGQTVGVPLPLELSAYGDEGTGLWESLTGRVAREPFNLVASIIFALAIAHTFVTTRFQRWAHEAEKNGGEAGGRNWRAGLWHVLGEVELVFGLWVAPLVAAIILYFGWSAGWAATAGYFGGLHFDEPVFVVVAMAVASTRPVLRLAEQILRQFARAGGETPGAWWAAILTVGPVLGSLITEPAAMTIAAMLLGRRFFALGPSARLRYATLGLLFVNVSVGGTLTHFAAPPVLMVAGKWGWDSWYMLTHFGLQAMVGIVVASVVYYLVFRREFGALAQAAVERNAGQEPAERSVPWGVTIVHGLFLAWAVVNLHHAWWLIGGLLLFMVFLRLTAEHQAGVNLKGALLVGFFLAGLVVHGGLQGWWIQPVLERLSELGLFFGAMLLTAFNDNAAITYLAALSPQVAAKAALQHAVMEGAVAGGGLTVIANAPNPAGQSILGKHFTGGISPLGLLAGAAVPTAIVAACFRMLG
jgi:hypothetical protein